MNTLNEIISQISVSQIIDLYNSKDYPISSKPLYPNLFGVRSQNNLPNKFDDVVGMFFLLENEQDYEMQIFDATTDPGLYWLKNPSSNLGTAILKPGSYKSYVLGKHQGKYDAIVQKGGKVTVYRDGNRDGVLDNEDSSGGTEEGFFGINIHRANESNASIQVDKWSAGCQVIASPTDFNTLLSTAKNAGKIYGVDSLFRYSLFVERDFVPYL